MLETYFVWVINHTNKKYTLLGALSATQETELISVVNMLQRNGLNITRTSFNANVSLNTQLNTPDDITENYIFVPVDDVVDNFKFINVL